MSAEPPIEHPTYILGAEAIEACFGKGDDFAYLDFGNLQALVFKAIELYEKRHAHPTPDRDGLIEKMEAGKVSNGLTRKLDGWNDAIDMCIAIVRHHFATMGESSTGNTEEGSNAKLLGSSPATYSDVSYLDRQHFATMWDALSPSARGAVTNNSVSAPSPTNQSEISGVADAFDRCWDIHGAMQGKSMRDTLKSYFIFGHATKIEPVSGDGMAERIKYAIEMLEHGYGDALMRSASALVILKGTQL